MKDNSYVVIQSFMLNDLHLKGNELIVYAVIHGYTQDGEHWFYGTRGYLAEWCGATKGTVTNCLNSLLEKGYIRRREIQRPGHVEIQYQAIFDTPVPKIDTPPNKNCDTPLSKIDTNNNKDDNARVKPNNRAFNPPTLSGVTAHCEEKGYHFDPSRFFDYYEASGWRKANGKKVSNWKQCCVTWESKTEKRSGVKWDAELSEYADEFDF